MGLRFGFVLGMATGLAVGYMLGLFRVPRPVKDSLHDLSEKAMQLRGKADDAAEQVAEEVRRSSRADYRG